MKTYGYEVSTNPLLSADIDLLSEAREFPIPDFTADGVTDVDFTLLSKTGVTNVFLDLDLTLRSAWSKNIGVDIIDHLAENKRIGNIGFIAIATDSGDDLRGFARQIDADVVHQPYKSKDGVKVNKGSDEFWLKILESNGLDPKSTVNIGDRYKKDVKLPGINGLNTVMVQPLGKDYWFDRLGSFRDVRKKDNLQLEKARAIWCKLLSSAGLDETIL